MESQKLSNLLTDLTAGVVLDLALILAVAAALILVVQKTLPWLANRLRGRRRHWLLA